MQLSNRQRKGTSSVFNRVNAKTTAHGHKDQHKDRVFEWPLQSPHSMQKLLWDELKTLELQKANLLWSRLCST